MKQKKKRQAFRYSAFNLYIRKENGKKIGKIFFQACNLQKNFVPLFFFSFYFALPNNVSSKKQTFSDGRLESSVINWVLLLFFFFIFTSSLFSSHFTRIRQNTLM